MFLNSKEWRKFQQNAGREIFELSDNVYMIKMELPLGKHYLYSPSVNAIKYLDEIKQIGQKQSSIFFKYEPLTQQTTDNEQRTRLENLGFKEAVKELQPQRTTILDLDLSYEDLLKQMHAKTRYNIRLAERYNIKVEQFGDFEIFWRLLEKTKQRDQFQTHPKEYYKKLLEVRGVRLFIAYYKDKPVAAAIIIFYPSSDDLRGINELAEGRIKAQAVYLHGASDYSLRKYMAPYALHQEIILVAQCEDMEEYDFWGIDEKRWSGVTRFKRGFGGKEVEYIGSYDFVFKPFWYCIYKMKNKYL